MARQASKRLADVFLDVWTFRQAIQFAGLLLVCLLTVYSATSEETESAPSATNQVTVAINNVTNGTVLPNLSQITGTVCSSGAEIDGVVVQIRELARSKEISCIARLGTSTTNVLCPNEWTWTATLPRLRDGRYELNVHALLDDDTARPVSTKRSVIIDGTAPDISFFPLHDQQSVADFSEVGGEVDEVSTIEFSICRVDETAEHNTYWNGTSWTTNRSDPAIRMRAGSVGDLWFASAEIPLPKVSEIPAGNYLVSAFAFDPAGNEGRAAVTVVKKTLPFSAKLEPPSEALDQDDP